MAQSTTTGSPHERPIGSNSSALCLTRQSPQLPNDQVKFATYTRDSATGNDYADQRYYTSTLGRFMIVDQSVSSLRLSNPQSWNRYSYASGDPINANDPTGLCTAMLAGLTMDPTDPDFDNEQIALGAVAGYPYSGWGRSLGG